MSNPELEGVMRRIQKLLAIAGDDRADPAEAAAAAGMAERIMAKYQLAHEDIIVKALRQGEDLDTAESVASAKTNGTKVIQVPPWANWLATRVAQLNNCGARLVTTKSGDAGVRFYGYREDVLVAKWMYDYLVATTLRLCKNYKGSEQYLVYGRRSVNSYRQGVSIGICSSISSLVAEKEREAESAAKKGMSSALVVVKKDAVIAKYGNVFSTGKAKAFSTSIGSAYSSGVSDGRKVNVQTRGISGNAGTIRLAA